MTFNCIRTSLIVLGLTFLTPINYAFCQDSQTGYNNGSLIYVSNDEKKN